MKNKSASTKDLYKNFIFLVASGIVLIAATVAWFAQNSSANVDSVGAAIQAVSPIDIGYYVSQEDYNTLAAHDGNAGSVSLADRQATTWSAKLSSIDIGSMYPGEFYSYKVVVTKASSTLNFNFNSISCIAATPPTASAAVTDTDELLAAVKVNAMATVTPSAGSETTNVSLFLTDLSALSSNATVLTTTGTITSTDTITFYYDIYLPGGDNSIDYEAFRESGAAISIGQVAVVD